MEVEIILNGAIEDEEVLALYRANNWSAADKPDALLNGLRNSHTLVIARHNGRLVGLGNAISDGFLVVYYPHMLVEPGYQGRKIGHKMMQAMQSVYGGFHQQMLTADGKAIDFYRSLGFEKAGQTQSMWIYSGNEH
jgi:GNAT superfamily N-acetyltransferase